MTQCFQFTADRRMIVDLAVKDDHRIAVVAANRLLTTRKIDDSQTHRSQRHDGRFENTLLIGSAMDQRVSCLTNQFGVGLTITMSKSRDAAQGSFDQFNTAAQ